MTSENTPKILLYPPKSEYISTFWRDKYEKEASKNWNRFYQRNANRFFKDRHYLDKEWGPYFSSMDESSILDKCVVLEVGCGTGSSIYPLISEYPHLFVHACDFASTAVDLVKAHPEYSETRINAFVCDVTSDDLCSTVPAKAIDVVTLIFMLSAVSPEKMPSILKNIKSTLKPGGRVLVRDYAIGDLAQERLKQKDQKICENFFAKGDGTVSSRLCREIIAVLWMWHCGWYCVRLCVWFVLQPYSGMQRSYYFSEEFLIALFAKEGFSCEEMKTHCRSVENRARKIVMHRRWVQGAFRLLNDSSATQEQSS